MRKQFLICCAKDHRMKERIMRIIRIAVVGYFIFTHDISHFGLFGAIRGIELYFSSIRSKRR
jgi:hypothetical protein